MIRAAVDNKFFQKFLWVFLGCMAFSLWCLYDAMIRYPSNMLIAEAYESIAEEDRREKWPEVAKSNGWPTAPPQKTAEAWGHSIGQQWFMFLLCMILGIPALVKWMRAQGTWIEGDENMIRKSNGGEVKISEITKIDKRKWKEKGIAKIFYTSDGRKKKFVMDDFAYERNAMAKIMSFAEANLSDEQIIGVRQTEKDDKETE